VAGDAVGSAEAAAAATAAQAALTAFNNATLNPALATQSALAALKAAIAVGVSDLNVTLLTSAAVAGGTITAGDKIAIDNAAGATPTEVADTVNQTEKNAVDVLIQAIQEVNNATVAVAQAQSATLTAVRDATAFASAQAAAAAAASPGTGFTATADKAVWVLNTANQLGVTTTPGTGYVLAVNDERNV
jgi:NADH dehydrogenase/NADH:ubiquinone oxidoreductase subunit G